MNAETSQPVHPEQARAWLSAEDWQRLQPIQAAAQQKRPRVTATSEGLPGRGSRFTLYLPWNPGEETPER